MNIDKIFEEDTDSLPDKANEEEDDINVDEIDYSSTLDDNLPEEDMDIDKIFEEDYDTSDDVAEDSDDSDYEHEELTDAEEFEYLWEEYQKAEEKGATSPEEISKIMEEADETYKWFKEEEEKAEAMDQESHPDEGDKEPGEDEYIEEWEDIVKDAQQEEKTQNGEDQDASDKDQLSTEEEADYFVDNITQAVDQGKSLDEIEEKLKIDELKYDWEKVEKKIEEEEVKEQLEDLGFTDKSQTDSESPESHEEKEKSEEKEDVAEAQMQVVEQQQVVCQVEPEEVSETMESQSEEVPNEEVEQIQETTPQEEPSEMLNSDSEKVNPTEEIVQSQADNLKTEEKEKMKVDDEAESEITEQSVLQEQVSETQERVQEVSPVVIEELDEESDKLLQERESEDRENIQEEQEHEELEEPEEEVEEEEYQQLQERYRQETGKRSIYAGRETKGFIQWLEQLETSEQAQAQEEVEREEVIAEGELQEQEEQEEEVEELEKNWKEIFKRWVNESAHLLLNPYLTSTLKEIVKQFRKYEELERLYEKFKHKELTKQEFYKFLDLNIKVRSLNKLYRSLVAAILAFKRYCQNANPWDVPHLKEKFLNYLSKEYINFHSIIENSDFSTIELIAALKTGLSKFSEQLAQIFPDRVDRFADRDLSRYWRGSNFRYIARVKNKILNPKNKDYNAEFRFPDNSLRKLEQNLIQKLGVKALGCLRLIQIYKNPKSAMSTLNFINFMKKELGRVSGEIQLTDEELSSILTGSKDFIHRTLDTIKNPDSRRWYKPNYKFPLERLEQFEENLRDLLLHDADIILIQINHYKESNSDLKYWHIKDYSIGNPEFFNNIDSVIKAYWYGFLCADGYLGKLRNRVKFELSAKDKERLESFINALGLDIERLEEYRKYYHYKGKITYSDLARIEFSSENIAKDLENLGFRDLKSGDKGVPEFIKFLLFQAKQESISLNIDISKTNSGKIALAWLLGFYDGDGTYMGGRQAKIYSSNKLLLDDIKFLFGIDNDVHQQTSQDNYDEKDAILSKKPLYFLTLGGKVFDYMMSSYKKSMPRKRSNQE